MLQHSVPLLFEDAFYTSPAPDLPQVRGPTCSEGLVLKAQDLLQLSEENEGLNKLDNT